ncbi:MAG: Fic family protein [Patescibacteria group bacterium]|nr:Fic family protein [Patescibacteria group bacterium]
MAKKDFKIKKGEVVQEKAKHKLLFGQEQEVIDLLNSYSKTIKILEQYDKSKLRLIKRTKTKFILEYNNAKKVIEEVKRELSAEKETSNLFGQENNKKLQGILGNIYQSFRGKEVYPSLEEKATHLLYFVIKDHPFVDGNKRIASFLFVYFLNRNNFLYRKSGEKRINDNTLIALTILIATSNPKDKDVLIKIITNLLND